MKPAKALIIGEALVDIVSPKNSGDTADTTENTGEKHAGGSAMNVAVGIARLGHPAELSTWIARDENGKIIENHLRTAGVEIRENCYGAGATSIAHATLDEHGGAEYRFHIEWDPKNIDIDPETVLVHTGSIAAIREPGATLVLDTLREARKTATISYDPNARPSLMGAPADALAAMTKRIEYADIVKASDEDLAWLTGSGDIHATAAMLLSHGPALVIITQGSAGVQSFTSSGIEISAEAATPGAKVVDTVGAGDSFMSAVIDKLWEKGLLGAENREALRKIDEGTLREVIDWASKAAGITVTRAGANPPLAEELRG